MTQSLYLGAQAGRVKVETDEHWTLKNIHMDQSRCSLKKCYAFFVVASLVERRLFITDNNVINLSRA